MVLSVTLEILHPCYFLIHCRQLQISKSSRQTTEQLVILMGNRELQPLPSPRTLVGRTDSTDITIVTKLQLHIYLGSNELTEDKPVLPEAFSHFE